MEEGTLKDFHCQFQILGSMKLLLTSLPELDASSAFSSSAALEAEIADAGCSTGLGAGALLAAATAACTSATTPTTTAASTGACTGNNKASSLTS